MSFFLIGIVAFQSSCGTGQQRDCEKHIREEIHLGVPLEIAAAVLKKCGFKTTVDPSKLRLHTSPQAAGGQADSICTTTALNGAPFVRRRA